MLREDGCNLSTIDTDARAAADRIREWPRRWRSAAGGPPRNSGIPPTNKVWSRRRRPHRGCVREVSVEVQSLVAGNRLGGGSLEAPKSIRQACRQGSHSGLHANRRPDCASPACGGNQGKHAEILAGAALGDRDPCHSHHGRLVDPRSAHGFESWPLSSQVLQQGRIIVLHGSSPRHNRCASDSTLLSSRGAWPSLMVPDRRSTLSPPSLPVRKYYSGRRRRFPLDVPEQCCGLCLPTFVEKGIGMIFISIDASSGAARSVAGAGTIRAACRRLVHGRQTSGGKGGNPSTHLGNSFL